ncbi:chemotaxis protein histidine kinase-like protein [Xenococcus sp. PCC 7305]|uniref:hybrid sensor histidine kinase/response regulator n=1 Tax=Xenococcus sp. PCC 7305 TaxID=102125 RepID=UPI0002AC5DD0|nr:hybrid sensor histidine kinase/response regulator [Xenococcus sp. PCC 7305]ELS03837.1 chemotaxis protein histidine kinase-like protein [Xenococcus sp. PCC 7305]
MDTEQQIRLNFLDEAEEYFDLIESNLLGLANTVIDPQQIDLMLRSAHSIKGSAAMMHFETLSRAAHRLEDFFKILRVRYASGSVETKVETLLLESLDCLRQIRNLNHQGLNLGDSEFEVQAVDIYTAQSEPLFEQLRGYLGDLQTSDENALLSQDGDINPALLIFEEGVDSILDRFENQLGQLNTTELTEELAMTAQELMAFGAMADLQPFIQLCQSIQQQTETLPQTKIPSLAEQALKSWRRSHALVLRGSITKLPSHLEEMDLAHKTSEPVQEMRSPLPVDSVDKAAVTKNTNSNADVLSDLEALESLNFDETIATALTADNEETADFFEDDFDLANLTELKAAFDVEIPDVESPEVSPTKSIAQDQEQPIKYGNVIQQSQAISESTEQSFEKMVRVPSAQLRQFNNLFEELILERNSINLRLQQLENITLLMRQRMSQIERSNDNLKQWYDRASVEGFLPGSEPQLTHSNVSSNRTDRFDALEMDRYSDVHVICQEQIETVVQLQEVTTDIELGLQEMNQAVRDFNHTTKLLQGNVTRTQMVPFAEIVKRFPRVIRDLNLQFNKQVQLKIEGENTLIDRSVIETLSDPLIHLLRNAFDHGIEDAATRVAAGKPKEGTITLKAINQGTQTVITLTDDGGGISLDKIRDRIRTMEIPEEYIAQMADSEILDSIFEPGFSTAQQVTQLSGRGVGMDIVRTNLREVRGDVQVDTELGKGTIFTLKIPFSLSILRVAIAEKAGILFAIPANSIQELLPFQPEQISIVEDQKQVIWHQENIPLIQIEKTLIFRRQNNSLNLTGNPIIDRPMALVIESKNGFSGLEIGRFWGEEEATIRPIESPLPLPPGVVSSMVLGDGKVIPLIDPVQLIEACLKHDVTTRKEEPKTSALEVSSNTILIVDDSINVRRYLSLNLEKAGYKVEQAKDGQEAVDKLLGGLVVQGVICDIEMPRLDGYGVLEELKERSQFQNLPIIMLTSRSNEKHRKLAINLGASAYFSKPYNEQELLHKLAEIVKTN